MRHPDEGTIHTWLDGQLPRDEAAAIEAHVAECQPCADAVAEARGLIAASSRILLALDGVPRGVAPKQTMPGAVGQAADVAPVPVVASDSSPNEVIDLPTRAAAALATRDRRAPRRWMSGSSLAAAAAIIVAVGSFTVLQNRAKDSSVPTSAESAAPTSGPSADIAAPVAQSPAVATRSAPPPSASGAASTRANELPAASAESRAAAPVRGLADGAKGAAANAKVGVREEAKQLAEVNRPLEERLLAKEQERVAADSVVRRQALASTQAFADSAQTKKADTTTVVVMRGRRAVASAPRPLGTPAPPPPAQSPAPVQTEVRDSRSDAAGLNRSATTGFIRGRVTDGNGTGIPNAQVLVVGTSTAITTNDRGEFSLGGVGAGQVVVRSLRLGYQENRRTLTVVAGQTVVTDFVMIPSATTLSNVVVTGTATAERRSSVGSSVAAVTAKDEVSAIHSSAIGCYDLGITSLTAQRTASSLRQVPRRVALDGDVVPSDGDGIWYRARDLAPDGTLIAGLWRPLGTNGVELEWKYGTKVARIRLTGPANVMMRGTVDELDQSAGTNESGSVVSSRRTCR